MMAKPKSTRTSAVRNAPKRPASLGLEDPTDAAAHVTTARRRAQPGTPAATPSRGPRAVVRWNDRADCLRARHEAAYAEAMANASWPMLVRVQLRAPRNEPPDEAIAELQADLFRQGADLVAALERFEETRRKLRELEERRRRLGIAWRPRFVPRAPLLDNLRAAEEEGGANVLDNAIGIVRLHAGFARYALEGKSSLKTRGRPREPARGRVAAHYARGWTDMIDGTFWSPTARDLALLAICEGAASLPEAWSTMTVEALLKDETRAMRPYLP